MPRVPVPDDYRGSSILVAGTEDYHYPDADVQVDAPTARTLQIREDDDGRYCGPPEQFADAVADYLGVESPVSDDADGEEGSDSDTADDEPGDSDANPEGSGGETPDADGELSTGDITQHIEAGECPWCDGYEGDSVPQHASSAHNDEWNAYKENRDG